MSELFWAVLFAVLGTLIALICLIHTSPITMTAFFFIGMPFYLAGGILYALDILSKLKRRLQSR